MSMLVVARTNSVLKKLQHTSCLWVSLECNRSCMDVSVMMDRPCLQALLWTLKSVYNMLLATECDMSLPNNSLVPALSHKHCSHRMGACGPDLLKLCTKSLHLLRLASLCGACAPCFKTVTWYLAEYLRLTTEVNADVRMLQLHCCSHAQEGSAPSSTSLLSSILLQLSQLSQRLGEGSCVSLPVTSPPMQHLRLRCVHHFVRDDSWYQVKRIKGFVVFGRLAYLLAMPELTPSVHMKCCDLLCVEADLVYVHEGDGCGRLTRNLTRRQIR